LIFCHLEKAGIADRLWSLEDAVRPVDELEAQQKSLETE